MNEEQVTAFSKAAFAAAIMSCCGEIAQPSQIAIRISAEGRAECIWHRPFPVIVTQIHGEVYFDTNQKPPTKQAKVCITRLIGGAMPLFPNHWSVYSC